MKEQLFISESGMDFYAPADSCFHIEESQFYKKIKEKGHVKTAEFILHKRDFIYIVKAKSSSPRPNKDDNFNKYISEICQKFISTFSLLAALHLKRYELEDGEELPKNLKNLNWQTQQFRFILVIKGYKNEWLRDVQDGLRPAMLPFIHEWNLEIGSVVVMNDEGARKRKLIR